MLARALIISIGFWGILYYTYIKEPHDSFTEARNIRRIGYGSYGYMRVERGSSAKRHL